MVGLTRGVGFAAQYCRRRGRGGEGQFETKTRLAPVSYVIKRFWKAQSSWKQTTSSKAPGSSWEKGEDGRETQYEGQLMVLGLSV